jgi:hypothetical protein
LLFDDAWLQVREAQALWGGTVGGKSNPTEVEPIAAQAEIKAARLIFFMTTPN